jgi:PAS domain S-box-containing protein
MRSQVGQNQREYILSDDETIVSKTDLSGNITYANDDFVRISGFSLEELIGAPQNIVRHPDMPREAFADLWKTIQSGYSWHGLVKNRCKNGDFYWVEATAAPLTKNGKTIGYTSVRVKPILRRLRQLRLLTRRSGLETPPYSFAMAECIDAVHGRQFATNSHCQYTVYFAYMRYFLPSSCCCSDGRLRHGKADCKC